MKKNAKKKITKAQEAPKEYTSKGKRKKGTYYDVNRLKMREKEQARRKAIKEGKHVPKKRVYKGPKNKTAKKKVPSIEEIRGKWAQSKQEQRERERLARIEEHNKKYPK